VLKRDVKLQLTSQPDWIQSEFLWTQLTEGFCIGNVMSRNQARYDNRLSTTLLVSGICMYGGRYGFMEVDGLTCTATRTSCAITAVVDAAATLEYEIRLLASLWSVGSFCFVECCVPDAVLRDSDGGAPSLAPVLVSSWISKNDKTKFSLRVKLSMVVFWGVHDRCQLFNSTLQLSYIWIRCPTFCNSSPKRIIHTFPCPFRRMKSVLDINF